MTTPDMNRIADDREISDVVIRYTWALDHRRFDDLADVFCEDATADYGRLGVFKGPTAIGQAAAGSLGRFDRTQHIVSNHQITFDGDGAGAGAGASDGARGRCYFQAQHVWVDSSGAHNYTVAGSYLDRYRRTASGWRIAERVLRVTWTDGGPPAGVPARDGEAASSMMSTAFVIAGWIDVDPDARAELLEAAVVMMSETAKEPGNLDYNFAADPADPARVRIFERWRSDADLRGHFDAPHMAVFAKALSKAGVRGRHLSRFHVSSVGPVFEVRT